MKRLPTLLLACLLLAGCGLPLSPKAIEEKPEGAFLKQTVEQLVAKDYAPIEAALDPEIKVADVRATLEKTAAYFPPGKPISVEFLGWNVVEFVGQPRRTDLTVEYGYGGSQWLLVTAELRGEPGKFRIWGFHVQRMSKSLAAQNAFTFVGKSWLHYFVIAAMALAFGITVYALVLCVRTAGLTRKWLWVLFIIFGVFAFNLNWTTGVLQVDLLHITLFSAAAIRTGFAGPWMLSFSIPLGAMVFLSKRRKRAALQVQADVSNQSPGPTPPTSP